MTPRRDSKDGLVLSGGGALGAFGVGVMRALFEGRSPATDHQPLHAEVYTGTSVGAFNAAFLASRGNQPLAAIDELEQVWLRDLANSLGTCGSDAYRLRTAPFTVDPGCLLRPVELFSQGVADAAHWARYAAVRGTAFLTSDNSLQARFIESINLASLVSPRPLYRLIERTISADALRSSPSELAIAVTNWENGSVLILSKEDLLGRYGLRGIAASAAVPGIYPPVELDGTLFVDGAVLLNTPLKPAIKLGADVIHVVYLDPEVVDIPIPRVPDTFSTITRMFWITQGKKVSEDIEEAFEVNVELLALRRQEILSVDFQAVVTDTPPETESVQRVRQGKAYRPLVIHRYRPQEELGKADTTFDFRLRVIEQLLTMGYENAVHHDCEAEGCILPDAVPSTSGAGRGAHTEDRPDA